MAVGSVRLSDLQINTEYAALTESMILQTKTRLGILTSGLAVNNPDIDDLVFNNQGMVFQIPFYKDLDDDVERIGNDSSAVFNTPDASANAAGSGTSPERLPNPNKIGTGAQLGIKMLRNNSWSTTKLSAELSSSDPIQAILSRISAYWQRRIQIALVSTVKGVVASNTANNSGDYTHNVSGDAFVEGITNITPESFIDATTTMGDAAGDLNVMLVHSIVYSRMQKNNLIDFVVDSDSKITIPFYLGKRVIVDDSMPFTGGVFETWVFGSGVFSLSIVAPKSSPGLELHWNPGAGNGQGQETIYSRTQLLIHPNYHSWTGSQVLGGGPTNTALEDASSWNRVAYQRKQIPFVRFLTREF